MKAIHVADVGPKQLYFLLESDNGYDGALVEASEPEVYVNFFEYVGNKRSVEPLTNSKFLKFFWTGHHGPLADRWEQNFIDQVIEPSKLLLDGVKILTKFNSTNPPNRAEHLKMRSNRALEYKSLISSGLNEKAFATRGARRLGRSLAQGSRGAATAGIRGFRRGVRFDPNAEDADGDGFVQEGTQFARRAQRVAREAANMRSGMRSSTGRYMPPQPDPASATAREIRRYERMIEHSESLVGGSDPEEILQQFDDMEDALSTLIGRPIRTRADAMEVAAQLHPLWAAGDPEMKFDLLEVPEDHEYTEYERMVVVAVLTTMSDPTWHSHTVRIRGNRSRPQETGEWIDSTGRVTSDPQAGITPRLGPDGLPHTRPRDSDTWHPYMDYEAQILANAIADAASAGASREETRQFILSIMNDNSPNLAHGVESVQEGLSWSHQGLTDAVYDTLQLASTGGLPADQQQRIVSANLQGALEYLQGIPPSQHAASMQDARDAGDRAAMKEVFRIAAERLMLDMGNLITLDESNIRPTRIEVAYTGESNPRAPGEYQSMPWTKWGYVEPASRYRFAVSDAVYQTLMIHADKLPAGEEREKARKRAAAIANATTVLHELAGHGQQDMRVLEHALKATGKTDLIEQQRDLFSTAIDTVTTELIENDNLIGLALDLDTTRKMMDGRSSVMSLAFGPIGVMFEDIVSPNSGRSRLRPSQRGIHGLLRMPRPPGDPKREQLVTWLQQPVLDAVGNPYAATAGLAQYFSGLAAAADAEWGIDLTISEGDQLTLAHILFGMWPSENGVEALTHGSVTNRKGQWYGGQGQTPHLAPDTVSVMGQHIPSGTIVPREMLGLPHISGASGSPVPRGSAPNLSVLRAKGLPAMNLDKPIPEGPHAGMPMGTIKTETVSAEDAAPLLNAFARVTHEIHAAQVNHRESDEGAFIDELASITFDDNSVGSALDQEIGLVRLPLREFLDGKSKEQERQMREDIAHRVGSEYLLTGTLTSEAIFDEEGTAQHIMRLAQDIDEIERPDPATGGVRKLSFSEKAVELKQRQKVMRALVGSVVRTGNHWDDLSRTDRRSLMNLADTLGAGPYGVYGGTTNSHNPLRALMNADRYELMAEFVAHMLTGIEFPIYDAEGTRRSLTPSEVSALRRLFGWMHPGREPVIRSAGVRHE